MSWRAKRASSAIAAGLHFQTVDGTACKSILWGSISNLVPSDFIAGVLVHDPTLVTCPACLDVMAEQVERTLWLPCLRWGA